MRVFVVDQNLQPLMPCRPSRARRLLKRRRAKVLKYYPFTIVVNREGGVVQKTQVKVDPGSKTTGVAVVIDGAKGKKVVFAAEITHRGEWIKKRLEARASLRGGRRARKTRYRQSRFSNRKNRRGKLPPSVQSRVCNIETWVKRLARVLPVTSLSVEDVKFDTQKMLNPEISGVEYQQGTLWGYDVKEYLLEKWGRKCAYCSAKDTPLEVEHMIPKSRGGSNRVTNLTLACHPCNQRKGSKTSAEFGFPKLLEEGNQNLSGAGQMSSMRPFVRRSLAKMFPLETGTGGQTKYNRSLQGYPKEHWIDAACVGNSGEKVFIPRGMKPLRIKAMGHGNRQRCRTDKFGFPKSHASRVKKLAGFQTGDIVRATITRGKYPGVYISRLVKSGPSFVILGKIRITAKNLRLLQHADGYSYTTNV